MHREQPSIRDLAYQLWEARGRPSGSPEQDWLDAERQLTAEAPAAAATSSRAVDDALQDTFPASDPPASRLADEPPANAEEKWRAAGAARAGVSRKKSDRREKSRPRADGLDG